MKKLILALTVGVTSTGFSLLPVRNYGEPAPMGDPVKITPQKSNNKTNGALSGFSVFGGFQETT